MAMTPNRSLWILAVCALFASAGQTQEYDVVVYGGTSGGVIAAVQVAKMGKRVLLIEPGKHLGGLSSGGLGQTDIGNKSAIGGLARDFYARVAKHYASDAAWVFQKRSDYRSGGQSKTLTREDTMWTFEPKVAEKIFEDLVREYGVPVMRGQRLDLAQGVTRRKKAITSIRMESGITFRARIFIDATYEGDLMAKAGVSFTVGREANAQYGETLNGIQTLNARHHQLQQGIDPYVSKGDPSSGLLPGIDPGGPGAEGGRDHRVQAYCFRMCITDDPENRVPFHQPTGYDPLHYELLLRNFEAGERGQPWINSAMPNHKTDTNNRYGFSTDFIGQSYNWPEADYDTRAAIFKRHLVYQQGLMWTLANHTRVPEKIRSEFARWGTTRDEFRDNGGWPHQLYIREARRMVSDYVMTQHHCQARATAEDSVGLAAYTMDSHNVQRYVDKQGQVRNEGDVQVGGFPPYAIAYRSIVPKRSECSNLFVPVCLSATHIAFGSIRMEPVFMVLGQSAATAAVMAIDADIAVQDVGYPALRERLLADKQVLTWTGPRRTIIDPRRLPGIVVDDTEAAITGPWMDSVSIPGFIGSRYLHDNNGDKGRLSVRYDITLPRSGLYEVRIAYTANPNRASNVPVTIEHSEGHSTVTVNQRTKPTLDGRFISLGKFKFSNKKAVVRIENRDTDGYVIADAVQLVAVN